MRIVYIVGPEETKMSELAIIQFVQNQAFGDEFKELIQKLFVRNQSLIKSINPFIEPDGIIHVGGRINVFLASD